MATEIATTGVEGEDFIRVEKHGKEIIVPIRKEGDPYDSNPQIRALQLVHEGKLGGPGRGQGRKRHPRAAEVVAEEVRKKANKIVAAIDRGLEDENVKVNLTAAEMALKIERDEALLQLKEEDRDIDSMSKDEVLNLLFQLAIDPAIESQVEAFTLPESAITEVINGDGIEDEGDGEEVSEAEILAAAAAATEGARPRVARAATRAQKARANAGQDRADGRGAASADGPKPANPFTARAKRRAAERR